MRTLFLLALTLHPQAQAQFGPLMSSTQTPQAKSAEELDLYLEIYKSLDPQSTVALANRLTTTYPQSEFLALVHEHETLAYQQMNNYEGVLQAGEKASIAEPSKHQGPRNPSSSDPERRDRPVRLLPASGAS